MNRRSFMQSILLTAAAPAIVWADSLMRIIPHDTHILTVPTGLPVGVILFKNRVWYYSHDGVNWVYELPIDDDGIIRLHPGKYKMLTTYEV